MLLFPPSLSPSLPSGSPISQMLRLGLDTLILLIFSSTLGFGSTFEEIPLTFSSNFSA